MELLQRQRNNDHDHECRFNPNDRDPCYVRVNPSENIWKKGLVVRKVIGVPDSYVVDVDGCRYHHNKCDLILSPPPDNNNSDNHHANLGCANGNLSDAHSTS